MGKNAQMHFQIFFEGSQATQQKLLWSTGALLLSDAEKAWRT
jgi:hypothetical protein